MEGDARGFRVALVQGELLNPADGGLDALAVLEQEDWGAIQLPASDYPDEVAAPLLDQVAEQAEEFARHGVDTPPQVEPATADELRAFLAGLAV